jgi:hypothetical protein
MHSSRIFQIAFECGGQMRAQRTPWTWLCSITHDDWHLQIAQIPHASVSSSVRLFWKFSKLIQTKSLWVFVFAFFHTVLGITPGLAHARHMLYPWAALWSRGMVRMGPGILWGSVSCSYCFLETETCCWVDWVTPYSWMPDLCGMDIKPVFLGFQQFRHDVQFCHVHRAPHHSSSMCCNYLMFLSFAFKKEACNWTLNDAVVLGDCKEETLSHAGGHSCADACGKHSSLGTHSIRCQHLSKCTL